MMFRSRKSRSVVASRWSLAVVLGISAAGGGAVAVAPTAVAADAANPWATALVEVVQDGTGHGTASASFVNTANGFYPGDDSPTDYVVSSGDTVTYMAALQFMASTARTVAVTVEVPPFLEWPTSGDLFCKNGVRVTATRSGNTCLFTVPAGSVEEINAPLILRAKDTGGTAVTGQALTLSVAKQGQATYQASTARAVTVVSAPAVDVVVVQPPAFTLGSDGVIRTGSGNISWTASPTSGYFIAAPVALTYPGYAPGKGASTSGTWSGWFDVSAFPEGTTWKVNGVEAVPDEAGLIDLGANAGQVRVEFSLAGGWPEQAVGVTVDYPVGVIVDPSSFATDVYVNNGTGWQPGDGQPMGQTTADAQYGSQAGRPFANNDFSVARVVRPDIPPLGFFAKSIYGPRDSSKTVWEPENLAYAHGATDTNRMATVAGTGSVGPGTELTSRLPLATQNIETTVGEQFVVGDTWDNADQQLDLTRPLQVITPDGTALRDTAYTVQWSTQAKTAAQMRNLADSGWNTGAPAAEQAPSVRSIRFVFAPDALPTGTEDGAGNFHVAIPLKIAPAFPIERDGTSIPDTGALGVIGADGQQVAAAGQTRYVVLRLPHTPSVAITAQVARVNGSIPELYAGAGVPLVSVGDTVSFQARPQVLNVPTTAPTSPEVVVTLDPCLTAPVNTTTGWTMTVTPGTSGDGSGTLCGVEGSTGITLTFRPDGDLAPVASWTDRPLGSGHLKTITWDAKVVLVAAFDAVLGTAATVDLLDWPHADLTPEVDVQPATANAQVAVTYADRTAAAIENNPVTSDTDSSFTVTATIEATAGAAGGAHTDTVIVLPRDDNDTCTDPDGDGVLWDMVDFDQESYPGAHCSNFHGTYTVTASFDPDLTTPGALLYYTTDDHATLDAGDAVWILVDPEHPLPPDATALRVEIPGGDMPSQAILNIEITPTGNQPGDVYVTWMSSTETNGRPVPVPWPAQTDIVTATITGTVWQDVSDDGRYQDYAEWGIADVRVELYQADATGQPVGAPIAQTYTDADGFYGFGHQDPDTGEWFAPLPAGRYVVVMYRGEQIPESITSYYDQELPITQTYSYRNRYHAASSERSTLITLTQGARVDQVDFGFHEPWPQIALDKTAAEVDCTDGICEVTWQVKVTNNGIDPLYDITLNDRVDADAFDVKATGAKVFGDITQIAAENNTAYALAADNTVWAWGDDTYGQLGDGGGSVSTEHPVLVVADAWGDKWITQIEAGETNGYALAEDGTIYAWGDDSYGQLGNGDDGINAAQQTPVQVDGSAWAGKQITQIAAGGHTVLALADDGTVYAWGSDSRGQLGNGGTSQNEQSPVPVIATAWQTARPAKEIIQIAVGHETAYAVARDIPTRLPFPVDGNAVYSWGSDESGALGNGGDSTDTQEPGPVVGGWTGGISAVVGGYNNAFVVQGLVSSGNVYSWGSDVNGALGDDGTSQDQQSPSQIPTTPTWRLGTTLAASTTSGNVYLNAPGHGAPLTNIAPVLYSWGAGIALGTGDTSQDAQSYQPVDTTDLTGKQITQIAAGHLMGFALTNDGMVYAWGEDTALGNGPRASQATPGPVAEPIRAEIVQVAAGNSTGYALAEGGVVYSWGNDSSGQLGDGGVVPTNAQSPVLVRQDPELGIPGDGTAWADNPIVQIAAGGVTGYALAEGGLVYSWGYDGSGQLGDGDDGVNAAQPAPVLVDGAAWGVEDDQIVRISAGNLAGYAHAEDGTVYYWGQDFGGQQWVPGLIDDVAWEVLGDEIDQIVRGDNAGLALAESGTVYSWGYDDNGQLGNGDDGENAPQWSPGLVDDTAWLGKRITEVAAGPQAGYALDEDGVVYSWGRDVSGALGNGDDGVNADQQSPVVVDGTAWEAQGDQIVQIAASQYGGFALAADGTVYSWGYDGGGELGNGDDGVNADQQSPGVVDGTAWEAQGDQVVQIAAGGGATGYALADSGTVYSWGYDYSGQLGDGGTRGDRQSPGLVDGPWAGHRVWRIAGVRMSPITITTDGDLTTRTYRIPALEPGESQTVLFSASYRQVPDADQVVVNQAWVDSPLTPKATPDPAVVPTVAGMDPDGVPGNPTCDTDADTPPQSSYSDDSCDQVPALVPANPDPVGSLSGRTWVDTNGDGIQDVGEPALCNAGVQLFKGDRLVGETVTADLDPDDGIVDCGYVFEFLALGDDYRVQFDTANATPGPGEGHFAWTAMDAGGDDALDSDVDPGTGATGMLTVLEDAVTEHADGGVVVLGTGMVVTKSSAEGDSVTDPQTGEVVAVVRHVDPATGETVPLPVAVTVWNTSDEPLGEFELVDETTDGVPIDGWTCAYADTNAVHTGAIPDGDLFAAVLDPGESLTCTGVLPPMGEGDTHANTATITARGTRTNTVIDGEDDFVTTVVDEPEPDPRFTLVKAALDDGGTVVDGTPAAPLPLPVTGQGTTEALNVFFELVNTGNEPLTDIRWRDVTASGPEVAWGEVCLWRPAPVTPPDPVPDPDPMPPAPVAVAANAAGYLTFVGTGELVVLQVGESVRCGGMLDAMPANVVHADTVTVTANGAESGWVVAASDDFATAGTHLSVDKYALVNGEPLDGTTAAPARVPVVDGATEALPIEVTVTNSGGEDLTNLTWDDETWDGPAVEDWQCTWVERVPDPAAERPYVEDPITGEREYDWTWERPTIDTPRPLVTGDFGWLYLAGGGDGPFVLAAGDSFTCVGVLPPMAATAQAPASHVNSFWVDAMGVTSGLQIWDLDYFAVQGTGVEVVKEAVLDGGTVDGTTDDPAYVDVSDLESLTVRVSLTNLSTEALTDVVFTDTTTAGEATVADWACVWTDADEAEHALAIGDAGLLTLAGTEDLLVLPAGDVVTCTGTLSGADPADLHANTATVTATGELSGVPVTGDDDFAVTGTGVGVLKYALIDGEPVDGTTDAPGFIPVDEDGYTAWTPVEVVVTNTGGEALTDLVLTDVTTAGPSVDDWVCVADGVELDTVPNGTGGLLILDPDSGDSYVLPVGGTITCTGLLSVSTEDDDGLRHANIATVTGTGVESGTTTSDDDELALDDTGIDVEKFWEGPDGQPVDGDDEALIVQVLPATDAGGTPASEAITVRVTVTNTGSEPLTDFTWTDDTTDGPAATGWACSMYTQAGDEWVQAVLVGDDTNPIPATTVLPVGGRIECAATIPGLTAGQSHADTVTVTVTGQTSGQPLDDEDDFTVTAGPGVQVEKFYNPGTDPASPPTVDAAGSIDADTPEQLAVVPIGAGGVSDPIPVWATATNIGDRDLWLNNFGDEVLAGDLDVDWQWCVYTDGTPAEREALLTPGQTLHCMGTLTGLAAGEVHTNNLTMGFAWDEDDSTVFDDDEFSVTNTGVDVVKEAVLADGESVDGTVDAPAHGSAADLQTVTVTVTATNTGGEALTDVTFTDTTTAGTATVTDWACVWTDGEDTGHALTISDGGLLLVTGTEDLLVLPVGGTVICTGTLAGMDPTDLHANTATVTATGTLSGVPVEGEDEFAVTGTGVDVLKQAVVDGVALDGTTDAPGLVATDADGATAPIPVEVIVTNTGGEALTDLVFTDVTTAGPAVAGWQCVADDGGPVALTIGATGLLTVGGEPFVLAVGGTITCTGTVPATTEDDDGLRHANTATITGTGVDSGNETSDDDELAVGDTGVDVVKEAVLADGEPVDGTADAPAYVEADQIADLTVRVTVTNSGAEPLTDLVFTDTTDRGPGVTDWACAWMDTEGAEHALTIGDGGLLVGADGESLVLPVGATVTCIGTLAGMDPADVHANTASVTASGTISGVPVDGEDELAVTGTGVDVLKQALVNGEPLDGTTDAPGLVETDDDGATAPIPVEVTVTNTGGEALTDLVFTDETTAGPAVAGWQCVADDGDPVALTIGTGGLLTVGGEPFVLAVGGTITCSGTVPATTEDDDGLRHANTATITGTGVESGNETSDDDELAIGDTGVDVTKEAVLADGESVDGTADAPAYVEADQIADLTVRVTVTNSGAEPLTDVTFTDTTTAGDATVADWVCAWTDGEGTEHALTISDGGLLLLTGTEDQLVLPVGATVICTGTLAGMNPTDLHANTATVTATGTLSGVPVDGEDVFAVTGTGVDVLKQAVVDGVPLDGTTDAPGLVETDDDGATAPIPVEVIVTNTGGEALTDLMFTDETIAGPAVAGWQCVADDDGPVVLTIGATGLLTVGGEPFVLAVGGTITCTGTVPATTEDDDGLRHANTASITGTGVESGNETSDDDELVIGDTGVDVVKEAVLADGEPVDGTADAPAYVEADQIADLTVRVTVTNSGAEPLTDVTFTDTTTAGTATVTAWACAWTDTEGAEHALTIGDGGLLLDTAGEPLVLPVGATVICTGTLAGMDPADVHANTATVTATGTISGVPVDGEDVFVVTGTGVDVLKQAVVDGVPLDGTTDAPGLVETDDDGATAPIPVEVIVTNTGGEALTDLVFTDETTAGPPVEDWQCVADDGDPVALTIGATGLLTVGGEAYVLAVGGTITCTGTVPATTEDDDGLRHANTAAITGTGVESGNETSDDDELAIGDTGVDVTKEAVLADGEPVDGTAEAPALGSATDLAQVTVTVTATNTGGEPLTDVTFTDTTTAGEATVTDWACAWTDGEDTEHALTISDGGLLLLTGTEDQLVLPVGGTVTCTGTLAGMDPTDLHANTATVTATGTLSGVPVDGEDEFAVTGTGVDVLKQALVDGVPLDGTTEAPGLVETDDDGATAPIPVEVTVTNTGGEALTDLVFTDETTAGPAVTGWQCVADDDGPVALTIGTGGLLTVGGEPFVLAVGGTITCSGTVPATTEDDGGLRHANTASITGTGVDSGEDTSDEDELVLDDTGVDVVKEAVLADGESVDGTADAPAYVEADQIADLTVRVTVTNSGAEPLKDVTFTDTTTAGDATVADWVCAWTDTEGAEHALTIGDGGLLLDTAGEPLVLPVGATVTCTGTLTGMDPADVHANTATVTATGTISGVPVDGEDVFAVTGTGVDVLKQALVNGEPLDGTATAPALVPVDGDGATAAFPVEVIVTNTGGEALTDLVFTDETTAGPAVAGWQCVADDDGPVVLTIGTGGLLTVGGEAYVLAVGGTITCSGTVPATTGGASGARHADTATITGTGVDSGNETSDDDELVVAPLTPADVSVVKTQSVSGADGQAATGKAGDQVTYQVTVTNAGQTAYTGPVVDVLTDVLDDAILNAVDGVVFTVTTTVGGVAVGDPVTLTGADVVDGVLTFADGVPGGGSVTLTFAVTITAVGDGDLTNLATTPADGTDPREYTDDDGDGRDDETGSPMDEVFLDTTASLALDKQAAATEVNGVEGVNAGDRITWTFTVTNTGDRTLTDVRVVDPTVGEVTLDATTLAPGQVATGTVTRTVTAADETAGQVVNTAHATGTDPAAPGGDPGGAVLSNEDTTITAVTPVAPVAPAPDPSPSPSPSSLLYTGTGTGTGTGSGSGETPLLFTGGPSALARTGMSLALALVALVLTSTGVSALGARRQALAAVGGRHRDDDGTHSDDVGSRHSAMSQDADPQTGRDWRR